MRPQPSIPGFALVIGVIVIGVPRPAAQMPLFTAAGDGPGRWLGRSVAFLGDVNGDGQDDWMAGAPGNDFLNTVGRVVIRSGRTGAVIRTLLGGTPPDKFGEAAAGAGDFNGDGVTDIVVGSPEHHFGGATGRAQVFSGSTGTPLFSVTSSLPNGKFGWAVCGAGDVNGDGFDDVAVGDILAGTPGVIGGSVRVYLGPTGTLRYTWIGAPLDYFGWALAPAGDVNLDGYDDILVGIPSSSTALGVTGRVNIYSGLNGGILRSVFGDSHNDQFGRSVSRAGDVDGDGREDFVVGAPWDDVINLDTGSVKVFSGATGALLAWVHGTMFEQGLGEKVAGGIDLDGDDVPDFLAGAPTDDVFGVSSGTLFAWSGSGAVPLFTLHGETTLDVLGAAVAAGGDIDGDGWKDVIVGAPRSPDSDGRGQVRVISLNPALCALNGAAARLCTTNPVPLGGIGVLRLRSVPDAPVAVLVDAQSGSLPLGPGGLWGTSQIAWSPLVVAVADPSGAVANPTPTRPFLDHNGIWSLALPVPASPLLSGLTLYAEAYVLDFFAPNHLFHQSNLLTITFGT